MSSQGDDEIVDAITRIIRRQNDRLVLPIVFLCVPIATMFADLKYKPR